MTKMYLKSFATFTRNEVRGTHLVFLKRGDFKVSYLKFLEWLVSWEKSPFFFNSLGTTKISQIFCVY